MPEASGTQQDDWSHMETLLGARPKWNRAGRPSGVIEEPRGLEAEASGGKADQDVAAVTAERARGGRGNATEEGFQDHGGVWIPECFPTGGMT